MSPQTLWGALSCSLILIACSDDPLPASLGGEPAPVIRERARCGDGEVQGLEECDDGNFINGDSCDALCRIEPLMGGEPVGGEPVGGEPVGGEPVGGEPVGGEPVGGEPVGGEPVGGEPVGGEPVGGEPVGGEPVGGEPVGGEPVGGEPVGGEPVSCADDVYEDNNTRGEASLVNPRALSEPLSLQLCSGDEDFFKVEGCAGATLEATVTQLGNSDLDLQLVAQSGQQLAISNSSDQAIEQVRHTFADASPIFVRVYGFQGSEGPYTLSLSLSACPQGPECVINNDCDASEVCDAGACVPAPPECVINNDCDASEVCEAGSCVPAPPECVINADCDAGEVCEAGSCVPAPPECVINNDCDAGEVCEAGSCVPAPPECVFSFECPLGFSCEEGACVPPPLDCIQSSECGVGEICQVGSCYALPSPVGCTDSFDCDVGDECVSGVCITPAGDVECVFDDDCGPLATCEAGACVVTPRVLTCTLNSDCGAYQRCEANACVFEDDRVENNDDFAGAEPLSPNLYGHFTLTQGDEDWMKVPLCAGGTLDVELRFSNDLGDIDVRLYSAEEVILTSSVSVTDHERVGYTNNSASEELIYIKVYGFSTSTNAYDLYVRTTGCDGYSADAFEDNDMPSAAPLVGSGSFSELTVTPADWDWYSADVCAGGTLNLDLTFSDVEGDIDLKLFNNSGLQLRSAASSTDNEQLNYTSTSGERLYWRVYGFSGAQNNYDMNVNITGCGGEVTLEADRLEENNTLATAEVLLPELYTNLTITEGDEDWIAVDVCAGGSLEVQIVHESDLGDLELELFNDRRWLLDSSTNAGDLELVSISPNQAERLYARVYGFLGDTNSYDLTVRVFGCP